MKGGFMNIGRVTAPRRILFVAAAGISAGALLAAPNASAATAKPQPSASKTAVHAASAAPSITAVRTVKTGRAVVEQTITCTPNVQNPHKSTHVPGTVNIVATISCTAPVPTLQVNAALYYNGLLAAQSGYNNVAGSYAQNNAAVPCANGTYQGWGGFVVVFPPGYTPPSGTTSGFGNAVSITC
jgi:hypothetical protein